jgi:hypothetical protein
VIQKSNTKNTKSLLGVCFFIFLQKRKIKAMKTEKRRKNEEKGEKEWKE